jgi:hypothetical protein
MAPSLFVPYGAELGSRRMAISACGANRVDAPGGSDEHSRVSSDALKVALDNPGCAGIHSSAFTGTYTLLHY